MPLQPNIALQVQGLQLPDPLAQSGRVAQIQNALQQQRMGEMQIQNAMREQRRKGELEKILGGFGPEAKAAEISPALVRGGFLTEARTLMQSEAQLEETRRKAQEAEYKGMISKADLVGRVLGAARDQDSFDFAIKKLSEQGIFTPADVQFLGSTYDSARVKQILDTTMSQKDRLEAAIKERQTAATESQAATASAKLPFERQRAEAAMISARAAKERVGQDQRGQDLQQQRIDIERERLLRDEKRYDLDQRRVRIAEENQRRQADPEYQQMLERARAAGAAAGKNDQVAAETLPKVITTAEMMLGNIDAMIGKPEIKDPKTGKVTQAATRPHPGFEMTVGATLLPGARFVPGSPAADFQARFDQLKGESFLQAYETLKGGGQITNIEGEKGTQAINRMSLAQSEKEFIDAARELQGIIKKGVERAQSRVRSAEPRSATPRGNAATTPGENAVDFKDLR
jgi:hypothetical protein